MKNRCIDAIVTEHERGNSLHSVTYRLFRVNIEEKTSLLERPVSYEDLSSTKRYPKSFFFTRERYSDFMSRRIGSSAKQQGYIQIVALCLRIPPRHCEGVSPKQSGKTTYGNIGLLRVIALTMMWRHKATCRIASGCRPRNDVET